VLSVKWHVRYINVSFQATFSAPQCLTGHGCLIRQPPATLNGQQQHHTRRRVRIRHPYDVSPVTQNPTWQQNVTKENVQMERWMVFHIALSGLVLFIFQPTSVACSCFTTFSRNSRDKFLPQKKLCDTNNKISKTKTIKICHFLTPYRLERCTICHE